MSYVYASLYAICRPFAWFWRRGVRVWLAGFLSKIDRELKHIREIERLQHELRLAREDNHTMAAKIKYYQEVWAAETAIQSRRIAEARGER